MEQICQAFGMSRQAYYQGRRRRARRRSREKRALKLVRQERRLQPRLGTRKLYDMYYKSLRHLRIGRDKLFGLLRRAGLLVRRRRRRRPRTTQSAHALDTRKNLLEEAEAPTGPGQVWVADITYVPTGSGFSYASLITDSYSRKIVGYDLSRSLALEGSVRALRMALKAHPPEEGFIHHSDRGIQYCSDDYQRLAEKAGAALSMTRGGDPYANALAERVNGTIKVEYGLEDRWASYDEAKRALKEVVDLYNNRRPHDALDNKTPTWVHEGIRPAWAT